MATRSTNTMVEALQRLHTDVAQMKVLPDADLTLITELETMIVSYLRDPMKKMQAEGMLPPDAGGGQMFPGQGQPLGGGVMQGAGTPPVDELRRLMTPAGS
jgi:hypothetical protein